MELGTYLEIVIWKLELVQIMSFIPINKILNKKFQGTNLSKQISAVFVCEEFDKIMLNIWGDKIKDQAQTIYLKNNVLTVACLSSIIAQELKIREQQLLEQMSKKFGQGVVEELRLLT